MQKQRLRHEVSCLRTEIKSGEPEQRLSILATYYNPPERKMRGVKVRECGERERERKGARGGEERGTAGNSKHESVSPYCANTEIPHFPVWLQQF